MKVWFQPLSSRQRDARMIELMQRGHATHDELFAAQFKQWPMPGVEKDTECPEIIAIKGFIHNKRSRFNPLHYLFALAAIDQTSPKREIYINRLLLNTASPLIGIAGLGTSRLFLTRLHEVLELFLDADLLRPIWAYTLCGLLFSSFRYAAFSSFAGMIAPSLSDKVGEEQIHIFQTEDRRRSVTQSAFRAIAYDSIQKRSFWDVTWNNLKYIWNTGLTALPLKTYAADHEIQARIHLINVEQDRLPSNKIELYAMLKNAGIITPDFVNELLDRNDSRSARENFMTRKDPFWHGMLHPPSAEINLGLGFYQDDKTVESYWRDTLPYMYGQLLIAYGDSKGLEKFGFTAECDAMGLPLRSGSEANTFYLNEAPKQ